MWLRSSRRAVPLWMLVVGNREHQPQAEPWNQPEGYPCALLRLYHGERLPGQAACVPLAALFWHLPFGGAADKGPMAAQAPWVVSVHTHVPHRRQSKGVSQGTWLWLGRHVTQKHCWAILWPAELTEQESLNRREAEQ